MRFRLQQAGIIAMAAITIVMSLGTGGSGAFAQDSIPAAYQAGIRHPVHIPQPVAQEIPQRLKTPTPTRCPSWSLAQPSPTELSRELNCLAGAIYFEARGESLAGQLAVGRVIVARVQVGPLP